MGCHRLTALRRIGAIVVLSVFAVACGAAPTAVPQQTIPRYPGPSAAIQVGPDTVTILPRGRAAFPVIHDLLSGARRSVELEMYELQREDLVADLIDAHARPGVQVSVILDTTASGTAARAEELRATGIDVRAYPVRARMIDHVKLLVVDGTRAVVGGINWGTASAEHHDFDALVIGPAAANLDRVLVRDLVTCGVAREVPNALDDPAISVAATLPGADIRPLVLAAVEGARSSLDLELYVITDLGIVHAIERAHARGVVIRMLVDPTQRPSDGPVAELRAHGVPVRLYRGMGELLHAKVVVTDGRAVVFGSANWSGGGFARNHEVDLAVHASPEVARTFLAAVSADWAQSADGAAVAAAPGGDAESLP